MQETRNNCFGSKICSTTLRQAKTDKYDYRNITATYVFRILAAYVFRHSCLPVFVWWRVVLHIFDPKRLLRLSCILWCYYSKCYSVIFNDFFCVQRNITINIACVTHFFHHYINRYREKSSTPLTFVFSFYKSTYEALIPLPSTDSYFTLQVFK